MPSIASEHAETTRSAKTPSSTSIPAVHPILRDTIDAEFICRAKMDDLETEIMVLRPSGVFGGGVISGLNLLFESNPPVLPVGFDPMINPTTKEHLSRDLMLALNLHGKGRLQRRRRHRGSA